ncbi:MAG TPA: LysE family translocator [Jatrophihabitans sp.]|jgi:threonine/homoserine/homoserine lactone efflux protein|uniref:LysE family translocator n=1 Tax=Jatrophihabitans sp. TaxID=1932789 RepID=UPI002E02E758|nr:LysE family translocator [Jatrophihabitans sp.]
MHLLAWIITSFVIIVIPGPSVLFTIGRALTIGRRGAVISAAGNSLGVYLQIVAVALGVGTLVQRSSQVYTVIKFAGALYLVYLGVQAFRHRRALSDALTGSVPVARGRRQFLDGVLVGLANPKTIVFFTVATPQFVDRAAGHVPEQLLLLGLVFPAIALVTDSAWAVLAGTARSWLAGSPRRTAAIGGAGGLAIVGLGVTVAVTGSRS